MLVSDESDEAQLTGLEIRNNQSSQIEIQFKTQISKHNRQIEWEM